LWHRVRIGPFKAKYLAIEYQAKLEREERISTFVVDPEKVKRQEEIRDAKQALRDKAAARKETALKEAPNQTARKETAPKEQLGIRDSKPEAESASGKR
jgi:hypothetical protein